MHYQKIYNSPLGQMTLISDGEYLTGLIFSNSSDSHKFKEKNIPKDLPIFDETIKWLDIYFSGENPTFTPKYKLENISDFTKEVIEYIKPIPYGEVITYGDIANEIAKKKHINKMSSQAVGGAVGRNPICLIIPCHRVVGQNKQLTGYGGGIDNKIKLLELEKVDVQNYKLPKKRKTNE